MLLKLLFALVLPLTLSANPVVYFSPKGGCTQVLVNEIGKAKKEIFVQAYSFTSTPILNALLEAHKRGVEVSVILDKSALGTSTKVAQNLSTAGIRVLVDNKHAIAHNKITIVDSTLVLTGSFNYTKQAEISNAENLLVLQTNVIEYRQNWLNHSKHSLDYADYLALKAKK